jgi:perosamine synthetase
MIVTDNEAWADKAKYLTTQAKDDHLEYIHNEIGYNYRLSNVLAAIGVAQMEKLDEYVAAKRQIAQYYNEHLQGVPGLHLMAEAPWARSTYWMYTLLIDRARYGIGSRELLRKMAAVRIQTRPLWQPIHSSPAYNAVAGGNYPVSEGLYRDALSLPCSVGITDAQLEKVVKVIRR